MPTPDHLLEQTQWDLFWLPPGVRVTDRPELLNVGADHPQSTVNACLRLRAVGPRVDALVAEAKAAHHAEASRFMVTTTHDTAPIEAALERVGYAPLGTHRAMAIAVDRYVGRAASDVEVRMVATMDEMLAGLEVSERAFGHPVPIPAAHYPLHLAQCTAPDARTRRFVAWRGTEPVCFGGVNAYPELGIAYLWAGGTVPEHRGRGVYSATVAARIAWASAQGMRWVGLYAKTDTSAPVVARQGFEDWGGMDYWEPC